MVRSLPFRVALCALIILAQFMFLALYLGQEEAIHFWDYAMYANMARNLFAAPDSTTALAVFYESFSQNYNLLFAVPSLLSFAIFNPSRDVFILTNFLTYFVAFQCGLAFVLKQLFKQPWSVTLCASTALCALVPFMWYPLFQGYPDHAAAASLTFAVGFTLSEKPRLRDRIATGFFLGLAILFRRHYAYPAIAVIISLALYEAAIATPRRWLDKTWIKNKLGHFILLGVVLIAVLAICEPAYLKEMLFTDYRALYKSYERPPCYFVLFAFSRVGLGLLVLGLAGYGLQIYLRPKNKRRLLYIAGMAFFWILLWAMGPGQAGDHYLISLLPLFCIVGLFGLGDSLLRQGQKSRALFIVIVLFLVANMIQAFWTGAFSVPSQTPSFGLLSEARPPWVRGDRDELKRLATYIGETTGDEDRVVVVGSSFIFNQDLMRALYTDVLQDIRPALRFIPAPESDGDQDPPLDAYASGTVFLVATPTQYHLPAEGQRVVTALASRFQPSLYDTNDFKKDDVLFTLDNGVTVEVWRHVNAWLPGRLFQNLLEMRHIKDMPRHWLFEKMGGLGQFAKNTDTQSDIALMKHGHGRLTSSLFYDLPLEEGSYRVIPTVRSADTCNKVVLKGYVREQEGRIVAQQVVPVVQNGGPVHLPFDVPARANQKTFFTLSVITEATNSCTVAIEQLDIRQNDIRGLPTN